MKVEFYENNRFWVTSETVIGRKYLVDICGPDGWPCCACKNFRIEIQPKLEAGIKVAKPFCKHLRAVVYWLGRRVVEEMIRNAKKAEK
jgi:hypothetical protein